MARLVESRKVRGDSRLSTDNAGFGFDLKPRVGVLNGLIHSFEARISGMSQNFERAERYCSIETKTYQSRAPN